MNQDDQDLPPHPIDAGRRDCVGRMVILAVAAFAMAAYFLTQPGFKLPTLVTTAGSFHSGNPLTLPVSARCVSPSNGNARTCLALPVCSMRNWPTSPGASRFRNTKSGPSACCSASPKRHRLTGNVAAG